MLKVCWKSEKDQTRKSCIVIIVNILMMMIVETIEKAMQQTSFLSFIGGVNS